MELERRGKYSVLPLSDKHIAAVEADGSVRFSDATGSTLAIHSETSVRHASAPEATVVSIHDLPAHLAINPDKRTDDPRVHGGVGRTIY